MSRVQKGVLMLEIKPWVDKIYIKGAKVMSTYGEVFQDPNLEKAPVDNTLACSMQKSSCL